MSEQTQQMLAAILMFCMLGFTAFRRFQSRKDPNTEQLNIKFGSKIEWAFIAFLVVVAIVGFASRNQ